MDTWARSDPGEVNEPKGREGIYIFGVGGRVFSPKGRKGVVEIPFLCVYLLQFFRGGCLPFGSRGGGGIAPP